MGGRIRAPYPLEYKAELVRLVREEGRSPSELAREFEPSAQSIMNWVAQAEIDDGKRGGLTTDEKAELRRLRAENRVLRMEKDLLCRPRYAAGAARSDHLSTRPPARRASGWTRIPDGGLLDTPNPVASPRRRRVFRHGGDGPVGPNGHPVVLAGVSRWEDYGW